MPLATEKYTQAETLLNKLATEMALAKPGKDDALVPAFALITDMIDACLEELPLIRALDYVRDQLDELLENASPFSDEAIELVNSFINWAQAAFSSLAHDGGYTDFPIPDDYGANVATDVTDLGAGAEAPTGAQAAGDQDATGGSGESDDDLGDDVLLELDLSEDTEILREFQIEATEHLENIEATVLVLESDPTDKDGLASLFRAFHTIKGVAGFLHLTPIQSLAHDVESLLDNARNGKLVLDAPMITLILESRDAISALVDQVNVALDKNELPAEVIAVNHLIRRARQESARGLRGEKAADAPSTAIASRGSATKATKAASSSSGDRATIRVNTTKLDNLMDMVGELVIVQSQLAETAGAAVESTSGDSPLSRNLSTLSRITKELQNTSMALRMVPIKPCFQRVGRLVRDLSSNVGKPVVFETKGEDTELDRIVVEQIGDPLVHMVRNSLDHGIEDAAGRATSGKPLEGRITLEAYHLGSNIVIELRDDGKGIDPKVILAKAREKGVVSESQELSDSEILQLIFLPGFSTAKEVTDISGRGVGMDVVRRNIEKLRGNVELQSELGKGTTFKIKLPLTTAIIDGLLVRVGEDRFILPTTSVKVALRPEPQQISTVQGRIEILDLRGKTIPIVRLHERFNIPTEVQQITDGIVVIIETFGQPIGLLVDDMLNKQEVVIKSLGHLMTGIQGVAGGAILGDGSIALILDPTAIIKN